GEGENVAAPQAVGDRGDTGGGDYPARHAIEAPLHRGDLLAHLGIGHGRVGIGVARHEAKRAFVLHSPELLAHDLDEATALVVGQPLAEVVEPGAVVAAPSIPVAHALHLGGERIPGDGAGRAAHTGDRDTRLHEADTVEAMEVQRQRLAPGGAPTGEDVLLERERLVRRPDRELSDANGGQAERYIAGGEPLLPESRGPLLE